jgi:hypothetical protein
MDDKIDQLVDGAAPGVAEQAATIGPSDKVDALIDGFASPLQARQRRYAQAREEAQQRFENRGPWAQFSQFVTDNAIAPFWSVPNAKWQSMVDESRKRIASGDYTDEDLGRAAYQDVRDEAEGKQSFGRKLLGSAGRAVGMAGEAYLTGPLGRVIPGGTAALPAIASGGGRLALRTAAMPSLYAEAAQQRAQSQGGEATDFQNAGPAFVQGMILNKILGSMGKAGEGLAARVPTAAGRAAARLGIGAVQFPAEQQLAEVATSVTDNFLPEALKFNTHYGVMGDLLNGKKGEAGQQFAMQAVMGAIFAAVHAPEQERQFIVRRQLEQSQARLRELAGQGMSSDLAFEKATKELVGQHQEAQNTASEPAETAQPPSQGVEPATISEPAASPADPNAPGASQAAAANLAEPGVGARPEGAVYRVPDHKNPDNSFEAGWRELTSGVRGRAWANRERDASDGFFLPGTLQFELYGSFPGEGKVAFIDPHQVGEGLAIDPRLRAVRYKAEPGGEEFDRLKSLIDAANEARRGRGLPPVQLEVGTGAEGRVAPEEALAAFGLPKEEVDAARAHQDAVDRAIADAKRQGHSPAGIAEALSSGLRDASAQVEAERRSNSEVPESPEPDAGADQAGRDSTIARLDALDRESLSSSEREVLESMINRLAGNEPDEGLAAVGKRLGMSDEGLRQAQIRLLEKAGSDFATLDEVRSAEAEQRAGLRSPEATGLHEQSDDAGIHGESREGGLSDKRYQRLKDRMRRGKPISPRDRDKLLQRLGDELAERQAAGEKISPAELADYQRLDKGSVRYWLGGASGAFVFGDAQLARIYDAAGRIAQAKRDFFFHVTELGGTSYPRAHALDRGAGEAMARNASAREYAPAIAKEILSKVLPADLSEADANRFGAALNEMRLRHAQNARRDLATKLRNEAETAAASARPNLERRLLKEARRLDRLAKKTTTMVGKEHLPDERAYFNTLADPTFRKIIDDWRTHGAPLAEDASRRYRGPDVVPNLTQIPDLPFSMIGASHARGPTTTSPTGGAPILATATPRRMGAAKRASLTAKDYVTDIREILRRSIEDRMVPAAQAEANRAIVDAGLGLRGVPGRQLEGYTEFKKVFDPGQGKTQVLKQLFGRGQAVADQPGLQKPGMVEIANVFKPKGVKGQSARTSLYVQTAAETRVRDALNPHNAGTSLYVKDEIAAEYRKMLGPESAKLPIVTPVMQLFNRATLASLQEPVWHSKNLLGAVFEPNFSPADAARNIAAMLRKDPAFNAKLTELTRIGAQKPGEPTGLLWGGKDKPALDRWTDPTYATSKLLHAMNDVIRTTLMDGYKKLAAKGLVPDTESGLRDAINRVAGNYNRRMQHDWVRMAKDTGVGPFAVFGTTAWGQGLRNVLGARPAAEATTTLASARLRLNKAARLMALPAAAALVNMLAWGRPDGADDVPLGAMKVGEDKQGRSQYLDLAGMSPVKRTLRQFGAVDYAEARREGMTHEESIDRAVASAARSAVHPFAGPAAETIDTAATGKDNLGRQVAPKAGENETQTVQNLKSALLRAHPLTRAFEPEIRKVLSENPVPERKSVGERAMDIAGPFGLKTGKGEEATNVGRVIQLRRQFLRSEGKPDESAGHESAIAGLRQAALAGDQDAFDQAKAKYLADSARQGRSDKAMYRALAESMKHLDPVAGLSKAEKGRFWDGLNEEQRRRVLKASEQADRLKAQIVSMWLKNEQ